VTNTPVGTEPTVTFAHVMVSGRVQGVGYRAWCAERAEELGVSGWVRNRASGAVEALFAGPAGQVEALVAACRDGPRGAHVDEVQCLDPAEAARPEPGASFRILPTV